MTVTPAPGLRPVAEGAVNASVLETPHVLIRAKDLFKAYGPTVAVHNLSVDILPGEVIGLVGANGAGKSTLMRILAGVTKPDGGQLAIKGQTVSWSTYSPAVAGQMGIRVVYQELSLCTNLTVYENFFIEHPGRFRGWGGWRAHARQAAREALDTVFPGNRIDVNLPVDVLPIAQRQMVEIARAVSDRQLSLLILDEPTSSLDTEQTDRLLSYVKDLAKQGAAVIFISHRLGEVMRVAHRILVMRNGSLIWSGSATDITQEGLIQLMAGRHPEDPSILTAPAGRLVEIGSGAGDRSAAPPIGIVANRISTDALHELSFHLPGGQLVGVAGLEGSGQRQLLETLFHGAVRTGQLTRHGRVAYVTGDRKKEGIFPLWSVARNMALTKISSANRLMGMVDRAGVDQAVDEWYRRLNIKASHRDAPIVSLSGGNQQKVLIARALLADADIILLDDPTRGVDIATKRQLYELFREATAKGKLLVWYSTEDDELAICSRVLVMRYGRIVRELAGEQVTKAQIVESSFLGESREKSGRNGSLDRGLRSRPVVLPFLTMLLVWGISGLLSRAVFSRFGTDLLLGGAIPLVLASLGQMFIIGLSHVDLGVGAFMGLANVISATLLQTHPHLGALLLLCLPLFYAGMGALIYYRRIPAIIVTLGGSFLWTGAAYTIQSAPGGSAPGWLSHLMYLNPPLLPRSVWFLLICTGLAYAVYVSRYGTVLRGFGNNPTAVSNSGWSEGKAYVVGYLCSSFFLVLGGLSLTAITTASDANAAASYTLLTVASVVLGGGALLGGVVNPFGTLFGAITLSLIGSLLGFLNVSSNYVPAVQGALLLSVLALRLLRRGRYE